MSNPFATRFIRPGAIPYFFADGQSVASLAAKLERNQWWGEIIGPHGSGKSTLLATLVPELAAKGREVIQHTLSQGERSLDFSKLNASQWNEKTQVIIDGYEQLSWWSRWRLKMLCRRRHAGLLVTAHAPMGLPALVQTQPTVDLARKVVQRLLPAGDETISPEDIDRAFAGQQGNLRETLFALFDLYQARTSAR